MELGFFRISKRSSNAGVGNGYNDIAERWIHGKLAAHLVALSCTSGRRCAVWASEVDMLKDAAGLRNAEAYWREVTPSAVTMTSSPGRTSRSYSARSRSNAQVSEAKTIVSGPSGS